MGWPCRLCDGTGKTQKRAFMPLLFALDLVHRFREELARELYTNCPFCGREKPTRWSGKKPGRGRLIAIDPQIPHTKRCLMTRVERLLPPRRRRTKR